MMAAGAGQEYNILLEEIASGTLSTFQHALQQCGNKVLLYHGESEGRAEGGENGGEGGKGGGAGGQTLLMVACAYDEPEKGELLLRRAYGLEQLHAQQTGKGNTAAHSAAQVGAVNSLRMLLRVSRDMCTESVDGEERENGKGEDTCSPSRQANTFLTLQNRWKETALHLAVSAGHVESVKVLLDDGRVDIHIPDQWGRTSLEVAREQGRSEVTQLIEAVAEGKGSQNTANRHAATHFSAVSTSPPPPLGPPPPGLPPPPPPAPPALVADLQKEFLQQVKRRVGKERKNTPVVKNVVDIAPQKNYLDRDPLQCPCAQCAAGKEEGDSPLQSLNESLSGGMGIGQERSASAMALSKKIEYPVDHEMVQSLLDSHDIAAGGKDMYGLTALMKAAGWNDSRLISLLLPRLSREEVLSRGGEGRGTAAHHAVQMHAVRSHSFPSHSIPRSFRLIFLLICASIYFHLDIPLSPHCLKCAISQYLSSIRVSAVEGFDCAEGMSTCAVGLLAAGRRARSHCARTRRGSRSCSSVNDDLRGDENRVFYVFS